MAADFNPQGMPGFFEKLQRNSSLSGQGLEFLRTHPLTVNRIADTRARANSYPLKKKYQESNSYEFIRAKLVVLASRNPLDAVKYFQVKLENEQSGNQYDANRYGYALAQIEAGDYNQAEKFLQALLAQDSENISYMLAAADLEVRRNNYPEAFRIYEQAHKIYPDYRPVVFSYTKTLLQASRPIKAKELLYKYSKYHEADLTYYNYLTRAEAESGNIIESRIANAGHFYLSGETRVAIGQLKSMLRQNTPRPNYYQEERIRARLAFFEQELKIERDLKLAR